MSLAARYCIFKLQHIKYISILSLISLAFLEAIRKASKLQRKPATLQILNHERFQACCHSNLSPTHIELLVHYHISVKLVQHSHSWFTHGSVYEKQINPLTRNASKYVNEPETTIPRTHQWSNVFCHSKNMVGSGITVSFEIQQFVTVMYC